MYYFLNTIVNEDKSGIEHAEMKRIAMFKEHHVPAKIVTRDFSLTFHDVIHRVGLADSDVINLFDFFGESSDFKAQACTINDLPISDNLELLVNDQDPHGYMVRNAQRIIQRIGMRAPDYQQIEVIRTYDALGHLAKAEWYDSRGFRALEQFFDADGNLLSEQVYNPQGKLYYQTFHQRSPFSNQKIVNTLYRLIDWHGHDYSFNGQKELTRFFYDELNKQSSHNVFIVDRTMELAWSALHMQTPALKYMHLHSAHLNNHDDILHSTLNFNYEYALNNLNKWDGVIIPTARQATDFKQRYGNDVPVYVIPVGVVADQQIAKPRVAWKQRTKDEVIMVARLSPEKQQDQLIKAFKKVVTKLPDARLYFWGYANEHEDKRLQKLVADEQMEKYVFFKNYTRDIGNVYDHAQLSVLPSRTEGFSLALLESQAHGVPMIAYDVPYGPQEIIHNDEDGYLIQPNDVDALAQKIIELLSNPNKAATFSNNAYENAKHFSATNVWQDWLRLMHDAQDKVTE
ncbi:MAG: glycosyltransferase [Candidatus Paralactobacillus gallistercoris]|uniref:Glycosyltransferase n=1 Tax=Candidatus Paralactobacillus gallistercoris TaxID=2838724 RepID=A0A948TIY8_9LACO|nr:glycosyltransferase [Candidatus Paralactobacillus gallistercoris]